MSESKWTPERADHDEIAINGPLRVETIDDEIHFYSQFDGWVATVGNVVKGDGLTVAEAKRMAVLWNAMQGVDDPQAFVEALTATVTGLLDAAEECCRQLSDVLSGDARLTNGHHRSYCEQAVGRVGKALSSLHQLRKSGGGRMSGEGLQSTAPHDTVGTMEDR